MTKEKDEKAKRLADALRANLRRRKDQRKSGANDDQPSEDALRFRTKPINNNKDD